MAEGSSPPVWSHFSFLGSLWDALESLDGLSYCEQCCHLYTPGSVPISCSQQLWSEMGTFLLCRGEQLVLLGVKTWLQALCWEA